MTTVTDSALARFNASIQKRSSMKLSLAGKTVDCTRYTWRPRTLSLTRTNRFPSEKRSTSPAPAGVHITVLRVLESLLGRPPTKKDEYIFYYLSPPPTFFAQIKKPPIFPRHTSHLDASLWRFV